MRYADGSPSSRERQKPKTPPPFSLRLSADERARLEAEAGSQPLGTYIRFRLLGDQAENRRRSRRPVVDQQTAARLLAELGKSQLAVNMNLLARAATIGTLDVDSEIAREFQGACQAIREMRRVLIAALGVKPEGR